MCCNGIFLNIERCEWQSTEGRRKCTVEYSLLFYIAFDLHGQMAIIWTFVLKK